MGASHAAAHQARSIEELNISLLIYTVHGHEITAVHYEK